MEKYTVIIPTRDRAETLEATIRSCLRQTYDNFEIIVSDNCSEDNTKEIIDRLNDARIRYIKPKKRLSMSGNFEFALNHVTDGFVMFIGADDAILPNTIKTVNEIVLKHKVLAVSCMQATYTWPSFPGDSAGNLNLGNFKNVIEIRNSSEFIKKTLNFDYLYCFQLPNLYCGFVHKSIINKAYKDGIYYRSITPDAYSAFATAIFLDRYAFSRTPFVIAGASPKSNGASSLNPYGDKGESIKFLSENDIPFHKDFINCPSYEVILGETFAQLKTAFPFECKDYEINYGKMIKKALLNSNVKTKSEVKKAVEIMSANFAKLIKDRHIKQEKYSLLLRVKSLLNKAYKLQILLNLNRIVGVVKSHHIGIRDIEDAALISEFIIAQAFSSNKVTIKDLLNQQIKKCMNNFKKI